MFRSESIEELNCFAKDVGLSWIGAWTRFLKSQGLAPLNNLMTSMNAMRGAHSITLNGRKAFNSLA
jgi:hypothetical protein